MLRCPRMWAFAGNRIAVRFAYECHDDSDHWYRSYGNENWEFSDDGLMASRVCINQRYSHSGIGAQISLGARASSRWDARDAQREKKLQAKLKRQAKQLGYELVPIEPQAA